MKQVDTYSGAFKLLHPLIKQFEGFRTNAYWDVKLYSIGFGTTKYPNGKSVQKGDVCTEAQAFDYMTHDLLKNRIPVIVKASPKKLTDGQIAALASFTYNLGVGGFLKSSVCAKLKAGAPKAEIAKEFAKYNKGGGKVLGGLVKRRKMEAELFLT